MDGLTDELFTSPSSSELLPVREADIPVAESLSASSMGELTDELFTSPSSSELLPMREADIPVAESLSASSMGELTDELLTSPSSSELLPMREADIPVAEFLPASSMGDLTDELFISPSSLELLPMREVDVLVAEFLPASSMGELIDELFTSPSSSERVSLSGVLVAYVRGGGGLGSVVTAAQLVGVAEGAMTVGSGSVEDGRVLRYLANDHTMGKAVLPTRMAAMILGESCGLACETALRMPCAVYWLSENHAVAKVMSKVVPSKSLGVEKFS